MSFTVRFRGRDEAEVLAKAELFWLAHREELSLSKPEFFARIVLADDGTEAVFDAGREPPEAGEDPPA